jgi:hypothetical protein
MRISLTHFSIGAAFAVIAFTAGCTKTGGEVLYCNPDDQGSGWLQRQGAMRIDLERGLVYGDDTSSGIYPLVTGHFAGFEGGFPLLIFRDSVEPDELPEEIIVDDILFRFSPVEDTYGDLWLITAKPTEARGEQRLPQRSTVLYSISDGVLLIGFAGFIGQEAYATNYVPCGNRTLRYDDLRRFADTNG